MDQLIDNDDASCRKTLKTCQRMHWIGGWLRGFGHFDASGFVYACGDDLTEELVHFFGHFGRAAAGDFLVVRVLTLLPGLMRSGL